MTQTLSRSPARTDAIRWRPLLAVLLAGLVALGGTYLARGGWSDGHGTLARSIDQMFWMHAFQGRPAVMELDAMVPAWREREGASGDRIIERIHRDGERKRGTSSKLAVLGDTAAETLAPAVLAEQAAKQQPAKNIYPAAFDGLGTGDRLTIATKDGRVYAFEVVRPDAQDRSAETATQRIVVRLLNTDDNTNEPIMREIRPLETQRPVASQPQQDL